MAKNEQRYCSTAGSFGVSFTSGTYIKGVILNVSRIIPRPNGEPFKFAVMKGEADGKQFDTTEQASAYAVKRGYSHPYYRREWCRKHRKLHTFLGKPCPPMGHDDCDLEDS